MRYSPEAFDAIIAEVEHQGGALLPEECVREDIRYTVPPYASPSTQKQVTCGCFNQALLVSTYDPLPEADQASGFVTACAVCDNMGDWPRYSEAVYTADPEMDPMLDDDEDEDDEEWE